MKKVDRRRFLGLGTLSAAAAVVGDQAMDKDTEEVPRFEEGALLTSAQLNRLVDEINRLKLGR